MAAAPSGALSVAPRLAQRLRDGFPGFTRAEKAVATYMLGNLRQLPFDSAASIADRVGVSQMTVGRFLRALGYQGLSELKAELRRGFDATPLLISERVARIRRSAAKQGKLGTNFEREVESLVAVYELVDTPAWRRVVDLLALSDEVHVAGFQTLAGMAADFAARLDYLRPGAHFQDGSDGVFGGVFAGPPGTRCVVLLEMRRYTRLSHLLGQQCRSRGVKLVVLCDTHCSWARDYTDDVLAVSTGSELFWDSQAPFASLTNLLLNDVIVRLGAAVGARTQLMERLQESFGAFQD